MAIKLKANIAYGSHLESVSRKFVPRKETCSSAKKVGPAELASAGWMGGGVRKSNRAGIGDCTRNYVVMRVNGRSSSVTANEIAARDRFADAVKGRNHIVKDLSQITKVQLLAFGGTDPSAGKTYEGAFNNLDLTINGVSAAGYTFYGWIMAVQYSGLMDNDQYNAMVFPSDYDA